MSDLHGLAIFGADAYAPPAQPQAAPAPAGSPLRLGPVLIGAALAYGLWRSSRGRK